MAFLSRFLVAGLAIAALGLSAAASQAGGEQKTTPTSGLEQDGIVHVPAFDLPPSGFLSEQTRAVLKRRAKDFEELGKVCLAHPVANEQDVIYQRDCQEKHFLRALIARHRALYPVAIEPRTIAGVKTEIITPAEGVSAANRNRVLINLHGGSFMYGGRWGGQIESIPIAALGKIKIISVDYRMAPEYRFPAASEDVAAVYKALLAEYRPENIGIYGCSAGGFLTAESVAWFLKEGLPVPGAIGMFCAGALTSGGGDSEHLVAAIDGSRSITSTESRSSTSRDSRSSAHMESLKRLSYFSDEDLKKPLAFPGLDPQLLARFPDSLLISGTRDFLMSSVVVTHAKLVKLGVTADLHIWEGLDHGFFYEPDFPESREVYGVIVHFFEAHLGGEKRSE